MQIVPANFDRMFGALADATRRDIVRRAIDCDEGIAELAGHYPMSFAAVQKHVDQAHAEFTKLARQYDALVQRLMLPERVAKLGREKERIAAGTGDMDVDFAAMRKRTASEQQEHERSMLKMYRQHYKAAKGEPITKSILFLRRPAS